MNAVRSNVGKNVLAFDYAIGQRVRVDAIDTTGIVKSILVTSEGTEYNVAYFDDDKVRRSEYMAGVELSRLAV